MFDYQRQGKIMENYSKEASNVWIVKEHVFLFCATCYTDQPHIFGAIIPN